MSGTAPPLLASAAAAKQRSFAAQQSKGSGLGSNAQVSGLDANKAYGLHAAGLAGAAMANGAPDLAATIHSIALAPHPAIKLHIAKLHMAAHPKFPNHVHMFTPTLMAGPVVPPAAPGAVNPQAGPVPAPSGPPSAPPGM